MTENHWTQEISYREMQMLKMPGFDPQLPGHGERSAQDYSRRLAMLGSWLFIGCGALFLVPLTQLMALGLAGVLLVIAYIVGREYNKHAREFVRQTSLSKLIRIFAPTWRYMLMTTILLGVGLGQNEWSFFAEKKEAFFSLIMLGGCYDLVKGLFPHQ
ncbi:hypothetical protein [Pseudomonas fluorescens]|nr:hypothetical protein [Pseudomonas fluorescens]